MADISILSRLVAGFQRNVDVSQNSLVVGSIKIGTSSPVEITKVIATKLLAIQAAADADGTFDTRYTKIADLASVANGKGASLIGVEDSGGNFTATNLEAVLAELYAAAGSNAAADITFDNSNGDLTADDAQEAIDELNDRVIATEAVADAAIPATEKGANNGVATLDGGGKVPVSQLPSAVMTYEGVWNASTNSPSLEDGTGDAGMVYRVGTAGSQDLGSGSIAFNVGDYVIYNGTIWEKSDTTDAVASVNGQTGIVSLDTGDIAESGNLYFTDERAQDAVISQVITNGVTDKSPSEDAVFDALVGKQDADAALDEAITFFENTDISGAEAETLSSGANADALHSHAVLRESRLAGETMADDVSFLMRMAMNGETAGRLYKADKDASSLNKFFVLGISRKVGGASAGDAIVLVMMGSYTLGANDTPFAGTDIGKPVYLTAAGAFSLTPPSSTDEAVYKIGVVEATNKIFVGNMQLHGIN